MMKTPHRSFTLAFTLAGALLGAACGRLLAPADVPALAATAAPLAAEHAGAAGAPATATTAPPLTPSPTPSPTATATSTPTPSPTPTPTATALPALVTGDPRRSVLAAPAPAAGAPCGLVDTLDFPIDPPDAARVTSGGSDFGVYRRQYGKYHAGEDWRAPGGGSSFGKPVYSIGHGTVTYADPDGWGRDKGVVIIRHVFPDGHTFLSFYGHLDPPSVTLRAGDCVVRGESVGNIGRPRTSPHLHFEIRTHMPSEPGPGYWPEDPTLAGWLPPSLTILRERLATAPGVVWARPASGDRASPSLAAVGRSVDGAIVSLDEDGELIGLDPTSGAARWRVEGDFAAVASSASAIYAMSWAGSLAAFAHGDAGPAAAPLWTIEVEGRGTPVLVPLPGGGVVVARRNELAAYAPDGSLLWRMPAAGLPVDGVTDGQTLFLSLSGTEPVLLALDASGELWRATGGGQLDLAADRLLAYDASGARSFNLATGAEARLFDAPSRLWDKGDVLGLDDGGLLLVHADPFDRRLIALEADGRLRWERSLGSPSGTVDRLLASGDEVLLLSTPALGFAGELAIYAIEPADGRLTRLFVEASRLRRPAGLAALTLEPEGLLLFASASGQLALFDPIEARRRVDPTAAANPTSDADAP